ncbi:Cyclin PHO80-like protein [Lasiodiplodia theobromae]|nr:Cyclin PHO80-like protein [Lasiodiplodia theobromae]KAF4537529.1 Cyclin PHO80-like protein [Lasiodiplodia theobromae]
MRQNPRRCPTAANCRVPPALVRQSERTVKFVDSLVDSATQMVEVIWPLSVPTCANERVSGRGVLPLRTFIQETLRRSRTSYSTLQVALYYLILIKAHVPRIDFTMEQPEDQSVRALQCGRRMFLAALILASKYLQDRNYSARAWSKISGLKVSEINTNEMAFLKAVNWKLHITDPIFERWQAIVLRAAPSSHPPPSPGAPQMHLGMHDWKTLIPMLTPELDTFDVVRRNSVQICIPKRLTPPPPPAATSPVRESWLQESMQASRAKATAFCLEPTVDMTPPAPMLSRLGPLPTPQMTPQSTVSNTPAVSVASMGSRRPSMCAAMAHHQNMMSARCTLDQWTPTPRFNGLEAYQFSGRRPSLAASTTSSSSSPDSMVSDNSSRSSRASSISSVSSAAWAPNAKLAKLATCRNAGLPYPVQQKEKESAEAVPTIVPSESLSSPDLEGFHINDASEPTPVPFQQTENVSPNTRSEEVAKGRKRCRSSADMTLQQNVRDLVNPEKLAAETLLTLDPSVLHQRTPGIVPDRSLASSFLLHTPGGRTPSSTFDMKALQSPFTVVPEVRRPVQKDLGRKRACCASEVAQVLQARAGPGMWEGII